MIKNYLKIAWRNLVKNKASSLINIGGLAVGMAVAMVIGLWIFGETSVDTNFKNRSRIAAIYENYVSNGQIQTTGNTAFPMAPALRQTYGQAFKHVIMASFDAPHPIMYNNNTVIQTGNFMEPGITDMLSLKMLEGDAASLNDPTSVLLSETAAKAIFGNADPLGKRIRIDKEMDAKITGVYQDLPKNCSFYDLSFIAPWQMLASNQHLDNSYHNPWGHSWFQTFVELADNVDMKEISAKIKDVKQNALTSEHNEDARFKSQLFLYPMNRWYLYDQFQNGVNTGGHIQYVWLFGLIGVFVLLLACINFMNLSTARSEKRAREVGIRKAIGSLRSSLITQFYSESMLIAAMAFILSLALVQLSLPAFNQLAGKQLDIPWTNALFWTCGIVFCLFTGFIAGSYPAVYLSSFSPVKVLKGSFRVGRWASIPRKVLVVLQFTVSTVLIIGTIIVFQQIQYAKNRPMGYNVNNLVNVTLPSDNINRQYQSFKNDLLNSGVVSNVAQSESLMTDVYITNSGFTWKGKDPNLQEEFVTMAVSPEFGKTVGWNLVAGRDFDPATFQTDSNGLIANETAIKFMGLKQPIGETIDWNGRMFKIIGVVKDMVNQSVYAAPPPNLFTLHRFDPLNVINIKINPQANMHAAIDKITTVFKRYDPSTPFSYQFTDQNYAAKFDNEEHIGRLSTCFAALAIFISCLGLFGMASFMAEQRVKEIGVRKVLGASVFNLWRLLSKDFVALVTVSLLIAIPIGYYCMHQWLLNYQYRTGIHWWIFAVTALAAVMITLATVSYQSIKAALANPVTSLRSE